MLNYPIDRHKYVKPSDWEKLLFESIRSAETAQQTFSVVNSAAYYFSFLDKGAAQALLTMALKVPNSKTVEIMLPSCASFDSVLNLVRLELSETDTRNSFLSENRNLLFEVDNSLILSHSGEELRFFLTRSNLAKIIEVIVYFSLIGGITRDAVLKLEDNVSDKLLSESALWAEARLMLGEYSTHHEELVFSELLLPLYRNELDKLIMGIASGVEDFDHRYVNFLCAAHRSFQGYMEVESYIEMHVEKIRQSFDGGMSRSEFAERMSIWFRNGNHLQLYDDISDHLTMHQGFEAVIS